MALSGLSSSPDMTANPFIGSSQTLSSMPVLGRSALNSCEQNMSNNSSSPTLSDSGISVDAASNGSSAANHRALTNALSLTSAASGML